MAQKKLAVKPVEVLDEVTNSQEVSQEVVEAVEITESQDQKDRRELVEAAQVMDKELDEFKTSLTSKTKEELLAMEEDTIKAIDENAEKCKTEMFTLPDSVTFRGKQYSRSDVEKKIAYFLNKQDVNFQMTLGMYELTDMFLRGDTKEISYHALDSVLRILGGLKFTGHTEWRDILIINSWLNPIQTKYTKLTTQSMYLAQRHNTIVEKLQAEESMNGTITPRCDV